MLTDLEVLSVDIKSVLLQRQYITYGYHKYRLNQVVRLILKGQETVG